MAEVWAAETENLSRRFRSKGDKDKVALTGVNLQIAQGEVFGVLGPNGAGKTTLIKILATLLSPSGGKARVLGRDVEGDSRPIRWNINMVSGGENSGYGILTVRENMWLFSQLYGLAYKDAFRRIDDLLEVVGLAENAKTKYNKLSTGMKQKLQFARGFLNNPRVLFLDEPTLGLDVGISRQIRAYIKQWVREQPGRTILLTTHYMAEADELCDRLAIIDQGQIIALDTPAHLKRQAVPESVLSLDTSPLPEAVEQELRGLPGVQRAASEYVPAAGLTRWTLLVQDDAAVAAAVSTIIRGGGSVMAMAKKEPTLEDVFLKLCGRRLTEGGEAA